MRDQEDQMDVGSAGRTRGSGHVRIPQRRINQSLRSGVSPSMNQPTGPQGHFQGVGTAQTYLPMRPSKPNYGGAYKRFQQMNQGAYKRFQNQPQYRQIAQHMQNHPPMPHFLNLMHQPIPHPPNPNPMPHRPMGEPPGQLNFGHPGGQGGGPMLGNGQQTVQGLLQALMGDLGHGMSADQFANLQAGNLPGQEHGDFLQALGGGAGNNDPLKALAAFMSQGQDGTYNIANPDSTEALQHMLHQAIRAQNPNMPGQFHFPGVPGGPGGPGQIGGGGQPGGPFPVWGAHPGGGRYGMPMPPGGYRPQPLRNFRRGQQFIPGQFPGMMQGQMGG